MAANKKTQTSLGRARWKIDDHDRRHIVLLRKSGKALTYIAKKYYTSHQRIHQILKEDSPNLASLRAVKSTYTCERCAVEFKAWAKPGYERDRQLCKQCMLRINKLKEKTPVYEKMIKFRNLKDGWYSNTYADLGRKYFPNSRFPGPKAKQFICDYEKRLHEVGKKYV